MRKEIDLRWYDAINEDHKIGFYNLLGVLRVAKIPKIIFQLNDFKFDYKLISGSFISLGPKYYIKLDLITFKSPLTTENLEASNN